MGAGGAERVAATLANAWASRGDRITLMPTFSGRGECFYKLSPGVRLVYLADLVSGRKRTPIHQFGRMRALRRFIAEEHPDVIVSFLSNVNVAAVLASAGLGIPVIVCERIDPFVVPTSLVLRLACCSAYPFADAVMVQTHAVAAKYASSGRALRRVAVIPNPVVDVQDLSGGRRARLGGKKYLLSIGRLDEQKQFHVLIRVFSGLSARHPEWSLRIVGEGPLRADLQRQIADLGLAERIELRGRTEAVADELAAADVFVLTSKYEGFPNALLEAMAAGLPCATFDCPSGPREMSMDGRVALLVRADDEQGLGHGLEQLMSDAALRSDLGNRARASVMERYSLDKVLGQWDALYEAVGVKR